MARTWREWLSEAPIGPWREWLNDWRGTVLGKYVHIHHQNLNQTHAFGGAPRRLDNSLFHWRIWATLYEQVEKGLGDQLLEAHVEIRLGMGLPSFALRTEYTTELGGHGTVPGLAVYWSVNTRWLEPLNTWLNGIGWTPPPEIAFGGYDGRDGRKLRIAIHDGALWWSLWTPLHAHYSATPKYLDGSFNVPDVLLGRSVYSEEVLSVHEVTIPMPERAYKGTVRITRDSWKRPRWPFPTVMQRAKIDMEEPIPFPGKGENSWDCGMDATHGLTAPAASLDEAIQMMVESVTRSRERNGGKDWRPPPPPPPKKKRVDR